MFNFRPPPGVPGFRVKVPDGQPGFRVGIPDEVPGFHVEQTNPGLENPFARDENIVPTGAPPTPCVGGDCREGGRYGGYGVIPHPIRPGQYLCPSCALKLFDLDIRDPEVLKRLE